MTRFNDSAVETAFDADHVPLCIAARLDFVSGVQRYHLGGGVVTFNGEDYHGVGLAGAGGIGTISAIDERPDARNYSQIQIGLAGVDTSLIAEVPQRTDYRGRYCAIYMVPLDPVTLKPVDETQEPWAEGFMDFMTHERKQGSTTIMLTLKSFDSVFEKSIGLTYTSESHKALDPAFATDTFFDLVPAVQNTEIFWGGLPAARPGSGGAGGGANNGGTFNQQK